MRRKEKRVREKVEKTEKEKRGGERRRMEGMNEFGNKKKGELWRKRRRGEKIGALN